MILILTTRIQPKVASGKRNFKPYNSIRMKKYKYILGLLMLAAIVGACTDEENSGFHRRDGHVYLAIGENRQWAEDGATRSDIDAPMLLHCDLVGAQPLYLHTEIAPIPAETVTDEGPETRGNRYTGAVFANGSVTNFGIYGVAGSNTFKKQFAISEMTKDTQDQGTVETGSGTASYKTSYWYIKEYDIGEGVEGGLWPDANTADFYGYAPYFAPDQAKNGNGLRIYQDGTTHVPTIEYIVPDVVTNQLDLLTAKHTRVSKGDDVELVFDHVLSAIKFKVANTVTNSANPSTLNHAGLQWTDGINIYNVTIKTVSIQGVYNKGTWKVGDPVYATGGGTDPANNWTRSTDNTTGNFTISPAKDLNTPGTDEVNPDDGGNVFMMMPQTVPPGAKFVIVCTMNKQGDANVSKDVTFTLDIAGKVWKPGYTYNYTLSLSDVAYVFDFNTATSFNATNVPTGGKNFDIANNTNGDGFVVRSYKVDANGNKKAVNWKLKHKVIESSVTGSNTSTQGEVWEDGSNGWMHLIDNDGAGTEVTGSHAGAYWDTNSNQPSNATNWYYRLEVGSIMTPVIDLSLYNYDQTKRWKGRTTANCYIVAGPGTYRIPLIYGNACRNDSIITSAYSPGKSASNVLSTFHNYNDANIRSPFIKKDVGNGTYTACLVWEEGDGTGTTSAGATGSTAATTGDDAKYGHAYNMGTVVKVIEAIDTYNEADDGYNTNTSPFESGTDYIQFEVSPDNFNYGNAVIGLRYGNTIVWSWHIWITDPSTFTTNQTVTLDDGHSVTLAGRNIGWVDGGITKSQEKRNGYLKLVQDETDWEITIDADQIKCNQFTSYFTNVLYQWGRKDPMRGNVDPNHDDTDNGAPRGAAGVKAWTNGYRTLDGGALGKRTVGEMIQEPNTIYGVARGDLYETVYYNLWAANLTQTYQSMWGTWQVLGKTIYDPSPVGYFVPPSRYLMTFARNGFREGFDEKTNANNPPIICGFTHGSDNATFYASGIRTTSNSYGATARGFRVPGPALLFRGALGFYHTSTPYSNDETFQLHLYFYGGDAIGTADEVDTHNKILGDMAEALSIIPMVYNYEQSLEEQAEPNEDPPQDNTNSVYPNQTLSKGNGTLW